VESARAQKKSRRDPPPPAAAVQISSSSRLFRLLEPLHRIQNLAFIVLTKSNTYPKEYERKRLKQSEIFAPSNLAAFVRSIGTTRSPTSVGPHSIVAGARVECPCPYELPPLIERAYPWRRRVGVNPARMDFIPGMSKSAPLSRGEGRGSSHGRPRPTST